MGIARNKILIFIIHLNEQFNFHRFESVMQKELNKTAYRDSRINRLQTVVK